MPWDPCDCWGDNC
ncbi:rCG50722 [Rattus norvegicus]|uniref:RCG50722 n=1 Tax=Rattus norvegicus TaxID=10116 RepID=A6KCB8_RAT|nr:rCG50722 [Rattus norvegicus]